MAGSYSAPANYRGHGAVVSAAMFTSRRAAVAAAAAAAGCRGTDGLRSHREAGAAVACADDAVDPAEPIAAGC